MWTLATRRMQRTAFAIAAALFAAGCGASVPVSNTPTSSIRSLASIAGSPGTSHLYVSDINARAIIRFPMTNGIPASTPDAVITGFVKPRGIAIGPDERLYAVDVMARKLLIFAPAPGNGAKPVRVIDIPHRDGLNSVAVDPSGNTYVSYTHVCTTEGFVCGYTDVYSSFESGSKFIKSIGFGGGPGGAVLRALSFDAAGELVVELGSQGSTVYYDALHGGNNYPIFCGAENDAGNVWGAAQNEIYETDLGNGSTQHPPQIVVIPNYLDNQPEHCPSFYTITSATVPLKLPYGIATNGTYIYVTDGHPGSIGSGVVLVFDPSKSGSQTPVATLDGPGSKLRAPIGVAVGP